MKEIYEKKREVNKPLQSKNEQSNVYPWLRERLEMSIMASVPGLKGRRE